MGMLEEATQAFGGLTPRPSVPHIFITQKMVLLPPELLQPSSVTVLVGSRPSCEKKAWTSKAKNDHGGKISLSPPLMSSCLADSVQGAKS